MTKTFSDIQKQFYQHIKNPALCSPPEDVEETRMAVYRELFLNNVSGFIENTFPVCRSLYSQAQWHELMRHFYSHHYFDTPHFVEIAEEFLEYLQDAPHPEFAEKPFIIELAHYEWIELALSVRDTEKSITVYDPDETIEKLYFSPLAELLQYQFPVQQISADFQPQHSDQEHFILVYRDTQYDIQFMQLNVLTALMLQVIIQNPGLTVTELLDRCSELVSQLSREELAEPLNATIKQFVLAQILVERIV